MEERFFPGKTERSEPVERSEASIRQSAAREQTAGGLGGAVSPPAGSRGSGPENFENLVPLDARKLLFQHAFSRYSAALKTGFTVV